MRTAALLRDLAQLISERDRLNPNVSRATVGWHLAHAFKVVIEVVKAIEQPKETSYRWTLNWSRMYVLTFAHIPRGSARSPKSVVPRDDITEAYLHQLFEEAQKAVKRLEALPKSAHWHHPYLGEMNQRMTRRFVYVHTRHHEKIVGEVMGEGF